MPLCHVHSLKFSLFAPTLSESLWDLPSDFVPFWAVVKPGHFCSFLLLAGLTLTFVRPTDLVEFFCTQPPSSTNFLATFRCFPPILPLSSCATKPEPDPAKYPPSILHTHALLPTSTNRLTWPVARTSSSHLSATCISCHFFCRLQISRWCQCGPLIPRSRVSHITTPAGPLTCLHI